MKIKKYGDAASEYKTRGADAPDINKEFSDIMKTMRILMIIALMKFGILPSL